MSECGLNGGDRALTASWTATCGEMCREKSAHDRFIETANRQARVGEPMRKVSNGVEVRGSARAGIPVASQIGAVRGGARTQYARRDPRAPRTGVHRCSSWKRRHVASDG